MAKRTAERTALLDDPNVRDWHDTVAQGSVSTADNYSRILALVCERLGAAPRDLVKMENDHTLFRRMQKYINDNPGTARAAWKAVRSWITSQNDGKSPVYEFTYVRVEARPRVDAMHIPTPDELRRVFIAADVRARAALSVLAFGGVRPQVLGNYRGTDGLVLGDLKDFVLSPVGYSKVPCRVAVRRSLSKSAHEFFTFLGKEACDYIAAYLGERAANGETLTAQTPLLIPIQPSRALARKEAGNRERRDNGARESNARIKAASGKPFIRTINVSDLVRKPMRAAGMANNPVYIWRSYFQSRAELAPELPKNWLGFFVGHKGDVSQDYKLHKQLPADKIELMRNAYTLALPYIETTTTEGIGAIDAAKEIVGDVKKLLTGWLTSIGLPKEEAELVAPENVVQLTEKALAIEEQRMQARAMDLARKVSAAEAVVTVKPSESPMTRTEIVEMVKLGIM